MNDVKHVLNFCKLSLYADDTVIWATGRNITELHDKLQQDLINISTWLDANKLSINVAKCKSMTISSPGHGVRGFQLNVTIKGQVLEHVTNYKYLGIYLDQTLSFNEHIEYVSKKVNKRIGVLKMTRNYMKPEQCLTLYKSLILPLLDYGR